MREVTTTVRAEPRVIGFDAPVEQARYLDRFIHDAELRGRGARTDPRPTVTSSAAMAALLRRATAH